jgi:hypothetical protein
VHECLYGKPGELTARALTITVSCGAPDRLRGYSELIITRPQPQPVPDLVHEDA